MIKTLDKFPLSLNFSQFVARQYWRKRQATSHRFQAHCVENGASSSGTSGGSVANFAQEAMKGQLPLSGWGLSGQRVEQFGRSEALFPGFHDHLSFLDHVHEFDPNQDSLIA